MVKKSLLLVFIFPFLTCSGNPESSEVRFGSARIKITPEVPIHMSGYAGRKTPSTGVHDDLYASALCFSNDESKALIVTADIIGFPEELTKETKQKIHEKTGIPEENILLAGTHTHGGPVVKAYEGDVSDTVANYLKELQNKIAEISEKAANNMVPVRLGYGSGSCKMNINRRAKFADGSIWLGRNPDGPCDHEVSVLKIESLDGKLLSLFVNWPCHGTANGQENYKITGDWPGLSARYINDKLGNDVIVAVTAGASGDINPIYGPNDNFREIEAVGYHVGAEVLRILPEIKTSPANSIQVLNETLTLPGKKSGKGRYPDDIIEKGPDQNVHLSVCKIGNYVFSGISGEVMNEIGMTIKAASPYRGTIVITHCNGSSGYICTDEAFPGGGYEVGVTKLWPGAEKVITRTVIDMISSL